MTKLSSLKALCEAATPGPWSDHVSDKWGMFWHVEAPPHEDLKRTDGSYGHIAIEMRSGDAELLAAARTYLPKLLSMVEATDRLLNLDLYGDPDERRADAIADVRRARAALEQP